MLASCQLCGRRSIVSAARNGVTCGSAASWRERALRLVQRGLCLPLSAERRTPGLPPEAESCQGLL